MQTRATPTITTKPEPSAPDEVSAEGEFEGEGNLQLVLLTIDLSFIKEVLAFFTTLAGRVSIRFVTSFTSL